MAVSNAFSTTWHEGYRRVIVLRIFRRRTPAHTGKLHEPLGSPLLLMVQVLTPILLCALNSLIVSDLNLNYWMVITVLSLLGGGAIGAAYLSWNQVNRGCHNIDLLFFEERTAKRAISGVKVAYNTVLQLIFMALMAFLAVKTVMNLPVWQSATESTSKILMIALVINITALVANDIYWLIVTPSVAFILAISCTFGKKPSRLNLIWHDPAKTPGLRVLAEAYTVSAGFVAAALFAVTMPKIIYPDFALGKVTGLYYLLIFLTFWAGLMAHLAFAHVVRIDKLETLDQLSKSIELRGDFSVQNIETKADLLQVYSTVSSSSVLPIGLGLLIQSILVGSSIATVIKG